MSVPISAAPLSLSVEQVGVRFGEVLALDDVTFSLEGPQVLGILGPNGAGKTTLLEILEGLRPPTAGCVSILGVPVYGSRVRATRPYPRQHIGAVLQREPQIERVTVAEYADLFASIYRVPHGAQAILSRARLQHRHSQPVESLSGGEAQRLYIAAALVHDPRVLFLDEPTAHLDPQNRLDIGDLLRDEGKQRLVIFCTHDLAEAERVCDRVLFLVAGRLRALGTCAELCAALPHVPPVAPSVGPVAGASLSAAFFHHCAVSIRPDGERA